MRRGTRSVLLGALALLLLLVATSGLGVIDLPAIFERDAGHAPSGPAIAEPAAEEKDAQDPTLVGRGSVAARDPLPLPPPVDLDAVDRARDLHGVVVHADGTAASPNTSPAGIEERFEKGDGQAMKDLAAQGMAAIPTIERLLESDNQLVAQMAAMTMKRLRGDGATASGRGPPRWTPVRRNLLATSGTLSYRSASNSRTGPAAPRTEDRMSVSHLPSASRSRPA